MRKLIAFNDYIRNNVKHNILFLKREIKYLLSMLNN